MAAKYSGDGDPRHAKDRRQFLMTMLATLPGTALLKSRKPAWPSGSDDLSRSIPSPAAIGAPLSIRQVIEMIFAAIPGTPVKNTVDTIKAGDPDQPVKGIVTTMFATEAVIEKAAKLGANFIIAHEPTFYNHLDETDWLAGDPVFESKRKLLDKYGIVVWRFHDAWHMNRPDGIVMGVLVALGWEKYYHADTPWIIELPPTSLGKIGELLKKNLGIEKLRVIGDLSRVCRRITFSPGAGGGRSQIGMIQKYSPDLFICGEVNEWETSEYIRDLQYQGGKTALVVLGHSVSEEPGMEWLIPWLKPKAPGIQITHIPSGDAFEWM
jgi:putative NIF3 family GTP cyclohydrolase 1 type 2